MPDREKVIKALECCEDIHRSGRWASGCIACPYMETGNNIERCDLQLLKDAAELLKEQEPVEIELEGGGSTWWYVCGDCHGSIDDSDNYCKHCGRRIKHEEKAE